MNAPRLQTRALRLAPEGPPLPDLELGAGHTLLLLDADAARARRLLRCLAGLESPASGEIRRLPATGVLEATWLEPGIHLIDSLSTRENLLLPARHHGLPPSLIESRLDELCTDRETLRDPHLLPGLLDATRYQRVLCARSLLLAPGLLALHHPLAGLAPDAAEALLQWLHDAARKLDIGLVLSLQDPLQAAWLEDTPILLLDDSGGILLTDWPALLDSARPAAQDIRDRLCRPCRDQSQPPVPS